MGLLFEVAPAAVAVAVAVAAPLLEEEEEEEDLGGDNCTDGFVTGLI